MSNYLIPLDELVANYYDPNNIESILNYTKRLKGYTLRPHLSPTENEIACLGKGDFGNLLESAYFKIRNNNESRPDLPELGIEIKSGQVKVIKGSKDVFKERLKISMIDYMSSFDEETLQESKLWPKLEKILLLLFRKDGLSLRIDETCTYSDLIIWTIEDIEQISADWLAIKNKVNSGKAHTLSEGDTWYLGACTAGSDSTTLRNAPLGVHAKVRAFSLKPAYLNYKLGYKTKPKGPKVILTPEKGQTLDEFIISNMEAFFDNPLDEVAFKIGRPSLASSTAKNKSSNIARALLEEIAGKHTVNISSDFEQFRKAGVIERTITLEKTGTLIESLSFPAMEWVEIANEQTWEESELYSLITSKFFFTVFKKSSLSMPIFIGCFFWTMPLEDIEIMKNIWLDTKSKVAENDYESFIGIATGMIGHIRPHGVKGATYPTPQGGIQKRQSFWLTNKYVKRVISEKLGV